MTPLSPRSSILALAVIALTVFSLATAEARSRRPHRAAGWELLGERTVSDAADHDILPVTAARGSFRSLKVKVLDRGVEFRAVKIHFANGDTQELELRQVIPAGGESRILDIAGGDRVIRSLELRYDAQSLLGKKARVRVYARD